MQLQYRCKSDDRRRAALEHPSINGIDYLEVVDRDYITPPPRGMGVNPTVARALRQRLLVVRCLRPLAAPILAGQVRITAPSGAPPASVVWCARAGEAAELDALAAAGRLSGEERAYADALAEPEHVLLVRTDSRGDYSTYRFQLVRSASDPGPPDGFDPILSAVGFSFKVECPSDFDCKSASPCPADAPGTPPEIDYLARDYASLRRLMLDRIGTVLPSWELTNPADFGMAIVEVLSCAGDYLSAYQDAAATESYLGTARQRISIRRHARLLDYRMHEGCNARVFVHMTPATDGVTVPARTRLLTKLPGEPVVVDPEDTETIDAADAVFETLHAITLRASHDSIPFYSWGGERCCLPSGATQATLAGEFPDLRRGDVLIFEQIAGSGTDPVDPAMRHAVRLTSVRITEDPLGELFGGEVEGVPAPVRVTEIEWGDSDAMPFPLCLAGETAPGSQSDLAAARGNIVLADHGRSIANEQLPAQSAGRRYRPALQEPEITHRCESDSWLLVGEDDPLVAAATVLAQDPRSAVPAVALLDEQGESWTARNDLLSSDRFAQEFVVEMDDDRIARLRFGDGVYGRRPTETTVLTATYRIGNGTPGNVASESIAHVVTTGAPVTAVRNPLPGMGGADPESLERVRLDAPQAFRTQERAVTEEDYAAVAQRHSDVQRAVATRRWTGSWHTMFLTVDRRGGRPVDAAFEDELRAFLDIYRMAGHDLEVSGPVYVPLDIAMSVCVEAGYYRADVLRALTDRFGRTQLPDGTRGFFHPDEFTFGDSVYASRVVAAAMEVDGVCQVDLRPGEGKPNRFQRWRQPDLDEYDTGAISMGRLEVARLDNDPSNPENGLIEFILKGGL